MTKNQTLIAILVSFFSLLPGAAPVIGEYKNLGSLNAVVVENVKDAPFLVFLHGYGGSGYELYEDTFQEFLKKNPALRKLNWIFPDAPGGVWFDMMGDEINIAKWDAGLAIARKNLSSMLKAANVDPKNVIWAGFSQGAATAVDFTLHSRVQPMGLIIDSGIYHKTVNNSKVLKGMSFQMYHDPADDMLPYEEAQKLEKILTEKNGMIGKMVNAPDGHLVHLNLLKKSLQQINKQSTQKSCIGFY